MHIKPYASENLYRISYYLQKLSMFYMLERIVTSWVVLVHSWSCFKANTGLIEHHLDANFVNVLAMERIR